MDMTQGVTLRHENGKVDFHFLAEAFSDGGWDVLFLTTHVSWIATWLGENRDLARSAT